MNNYIVAKTDFHWIDGWLHLGTEIESLAKLSNKSAKMYNLYFFVPWAFYKFLKT